MVLVAGVVLAAADGGAQFQRLGAPQRRGPQIPPLDVNGEIPYDGGFHFCRLLFSDDS